MLGEFSTIPKASDVARRDVPICQLNERLGEVHQRCQAAGWKVCLVVNESNVVLGRLRGKAWEADPDGMLVGLLYRRDGEQRLEREQAEKESNAGLS